MKKTFDQICADILGETLQPNTQNNANQQPPAGQQNQQQYQKTPPIAPKQTGQQIDDELMKLLQQKMQDKAKGEEFKQQLMQMLKQPQQNANVNAANQPA